MAVLLDSGFLFASLNASEEEHKTTILVLKIFANRLFYRFLRLPKLLTCWLATLVTRRHTPVMMAHVKTHSKHTIRILADGLITLYSRNPVTVATNRLDLVRAYLKSKQKM
jgi:hypothetical protein